MLKLTKKQFVFNFLFPLIALFLLWVWFLFNALKGNGSFALFTDNEYFLGPVFNSIEQSIRNFELPLRMENIIGGVPLYNFTQLSPFYPFYFFALPIFDRPVDIIYSMHWITLFHIFILEINTYIFLRVIGASKYAGLVGAALIAFSANSFSYAVWVNIVAPYSWFPLYLAGLIGILKFRGLTRYSLMALVGIVLLTFASPAQPLIHAILVTVIFVMAYSFSQLRKGHANEIPYAIGRIGTVAALALLITAPAILPALLEFKNMIRWIGNFPPVVGNASIPFEAFQTDQLSISGLAGLFFKLKGPDVGSQFAGIIVIALASFAAIKSYRKTWLIGALIFISAYALISATGSNLGLAYINYYAPVINKIREPSRFLVLFQFAVSTLAALGIDEMYRAFSQSRNEKNEMPKWWIILLMPPLIALIAYPFIKSQIVSNGYPLISLAVSFALVVFTFLTIHFKFQWLNKLTITLWGGAALIILGVEIPWTPPSISSSQFLEKGGPPLDTVIQRVAMLDPSHNYRVIFEGKIEKQEAAMIASYRNVRTLNSYFNPAPKSQFEEMTYFGTKGNNYFHILGAKYLICRDCTESSGTGYKLLEALNGYEIYETEDALPHSYIVYKSSGDFRDLDDFMAKASTADLSKGILFYESAINNRLPSGNSADNDPCIVSEDLRTSNHSRFVLQCENPGVLVMNEFFDKGWRATVDGAKIKPLKVNGNQIGVPFSTGSHIIEISYLPVNFLVSVIMMILGLMLLLILVTGKILTTRRFTANDSIDSSGLK